VDGLGDEFFAGAGLAGDEDGDGRGGDGFDGVEDLPHRLGAGDDALEAGVLNELWVVVVAVFGAQAFAGGVVAEEDGFGGAVDERAEDGEVERFFDEVEDAVLEGGTGGGDVAVGGDHDGFGVGLELASGVEDDEAGVGAVGRDDARLAIGAGDGGADAGAVGHAEVGDDDVEAAAAEFFESVFDGCGDGADVARLAECVGHDVGVIGLVLDDEDLGAKVGCEFGGHRARV